MKLLLIRHPEPDIEKGICYGQLDIPLRDGWQEEAERLNQWLKKRFLGQRGQAFHSPLQRALLLAEQLFLTSQPEGSLKELDFGLWEGKPWQQIPKLEMERWGDDLNNANPYQGESLQQLSDRLYNWWQELEKEQLDYLILMTHSGVIKVLVSLLCGWPLDKCYVINPDYFSVTELTLNGEFVTLDSLGVRSS